MSPLTLQNDDYTLDDVIRSLMARYKGLVAIEAWGETSLFYNPIGILKRGAYCLTFKQKDGENDFSSKLDRQNVCYRMNFKISKPTFLTYFDESQMPARPAKGQVITLNSKKAYDPTVIDQLIPHPVYGWMSWVSVINPSRKTIEMLLDKGLIEESYQDAINRHNKNKSVIEYKMKG